MSLFHCYLCFSRYCVSCLSIATWQFGDDIHDFERLPFVMLMTLVRWIRRKTQSRLVHYHFGIQPDLFCFWRGVLPPIQHFSNDRCPSVMQDICFAPVVFASSITFFLLLTFVRKFCVPNCNVVVNCLLFLQYGPPDGLVQILPYAALTIHWFTKKHTNVLIWSHWIYHGSHHVDCSYLSCKA